MRDSLPIKIGIIDTTFSRVNMGNIAIDELKKSYGDRVKIFRFTVPGIKDLAVECKKLLMECDIVIALGMVGGAPIDTQCGHEASLGIQQAKLMTNKHIIEVFVHENEAWNEKEFFEICDNRIRKHVHNAVALVETPEFLIANAGKGVRQGKENEGEVGANSNKQITLGFIVAEFNPEITKEMEKTALEHAKKVGAVISTTIHVPGVYDIPLAVKKLLLDKRIDAVVTLGAVIKGDTKHDEVICQSTANTLATLSLDFNKPISLGIIGPGATDAQADARKKEYAERAVDAAITLVKRLRR